MRKRIIAVLLLQVFATLLWLAHDRYLREEHSSRQYKLGVLTGRDEFRSDILKNGGEIPDTVYAHHDKDLVLNLGESIHSFTVIYPLIAMQGLALILLLSLACSRPCKSEFDRGSAERDEESTKGRPRT